MTSAEYDCLGKQMKEMVDRIVEQRIEETKDEIIEEFLDNASPWDNEFESLRDSWEEGVHDHCHEECVYIGDGYSHLLKHIAWSDVRDYFEDQINGYALDVADERMEDFKDRVRSLLDTLKDIPSEVEEIECDL